MTLMYAVTEECHSVLEERVAKIESDVSFLRAGFADLKTDQREMRQDIKALAGELHLFRVEMTKEMGALRSEFSEEIVGKVGALKCEVSDFKTEFADFRAEVADFKTEVAKRFGAVDASIETTKRWAVVSGVSAIVTLMGVLGTLVAVGRTLKWF